MAEDRTTRAWFHAARRGNLTYLQQNIGRVNVNCQENGSKETALMSAAFNGQSKCVMWLVNDGHADIHIRDALGETALLKAARHGDDFSLIFLLDKGALIDAVGVHRHPPLMSAVCNRHVNCVQILVDRRAMLDVVDSLGSTALMQAAFADSFESVQCLLRAGALVNITDNNGQTALIKAAINRNPRIIELLIDYRAHVNKKDNAGCTALTHVLAAWRSPRPWDTLDTDMQCIQLLCRFGADVDCVDHVNETVLMRAAAIGYFECVNFLVEEKNAKTDIFNNAGQTALMIAAKNGFVDILQFLCERDKTDLKDVPDMEGYSPIMHAAQNNMGECVEMLVSYGVRLNVLTPDGTTPLMAMATAGFGSTVQALLDGGADPGRENSSGQTALELASDNLCRDKIKRALVVSET